MEYPYYLLALAGIPLITWIYFRYRSIRRKSLQQFGERILVEQLTSSGSTLRSFIKWLLPLLAFCLIIIGLSNIQSAGGLNTVKHEGLDIAVALDVSNSMLAGDIKPNRLEVATQFVSQLVERLPDARISFVTFAGTPVLQVPLTVDHSTVELLLNNIAPDHMPEQGTDIGAAITEAAKSLPENQNHYRIIILVSDGEDQEGKIAEALEGIANEQIVFFTVGTGISAGSYIPVIVNGQQTVKRDVSGNTIVSKLNETILNKIASTTHGLYVRADSNQPVDQLISRLNEINKSRFDEQVLMQYESHYRWFLFPALLLLVIDLLISNRKLRLNFPFIKKTSGQ
jgi:Ca-activated chloride channel family protein